MNADNDCNVVFVGPVFDELVQIVYGSWSEGLPVSTTSVVETSNPEPNRNSDAVQTIRSDFLNITFSNPGASVLIKSPISVGMA
jgi:hypothetical protein